MILLHYEYLSIWFIAFSSLQTTFILLAQEEDLIEKFADKSQFVEHHLVPLSADVPPIPYDLIEQNSKRFDRVSQFDNNNSDDSESSDEWIPINTVVHISSANGTVNQLPSIRNIFNTSNYRQRVFANKTASQWRINDDNYDESSYELKQSQSDSTASKQNDIENSIYSISNRSEINNISKPIIQPSIYDTFLPNSSVLKIGRNEENGEIELIDENRFNTKTDDDNGRLLIRIGGQKTVTINHLKTESNLSTTTTMLTTTTLTTTTLKTTTIIPPLLGWNILSTQTTTTPTTTSKSSNATEQSLLTTSEPYPVAGCGWNIFNNTCSDVFNLHWCKGGCVDFGNLIFHDCRCVTDW